jgi:hypothetical protein
MVTSNDCLKKYGQPSAANKCLQLWEPNDIIRKGPVPRRIYCNVDMVKPLRQALINLVTRGMMPELKTWDGCFNIRSMRGASTMSLHSWGVAIDINASENRLGQIPVLSPGFVQCFTDAGFEWGGTWKRPDGMHFQLARI